MSSTSEGESKSAAAAARRRAAAARRKRILEQSRERMSTVEGLPSVPVPSELDGGTEAGDEGDGADGALIDESQTDETNVTSSAADAVVEGEANLSTQEKADENETPADDGGGVGVRDGGQEGSSKPSSSRALQQMRRRRFKKPEAQEGDVQPKPHSENNMEVEDDDKNETVSPPQPPDTSSQSNKPKAYKGVAKMRRQRILEERAKKGEEDQDLIDPATGDLAVELDGAFDQKTKLIELQVPVTMDLIVVALLIFSGMSMGYESFCHNATGAEDQIGFRRLLHEHGGVVKAGFHLGEQIFQALPFGFNEETSVKSKVLVTENLLPAHDSGDTVGAESSDNEFPESPENDNEEPLKNPDDDDDDDISFDNPYEDKKGNSNAGDPLMLIDALMGFFLNIMSKFFGIFTGVFNFTCPPVFFLTAAALRQAGRMMGCKAPSEAEQNLEDSISASLSAMSGKDEVVGSLPSFDFIRMIKKFLSSKFTTLFTLFSILSDARADVYLVLYGWFLGLVVPTLYTWYVTENENGKDTSGNSLFWSGQSFSGSSEL